MLKRGLVTEIYPNEGLCRVKFLEDGIVSPKLQIVFPGAKDNKFYIPFAINEQVACLMSDNTDDGVVLGALYNKQDTPTGVNDHVCKIVFKDGSNITYDFNSHNLNLDIAGDVTISSSGTIQIAATDNGVTINGDVEVTGDVTINGDTSVDGKITATDKIESDTEVKAGTIELTLHTHSGVQTGGGTSGPPVP